MRVRGFEIAKGWEDKDIHLPKRSTKNSAAYDIEAAQDVVIPPYKPGIQYRTGRAIRLRSQIRKPVRLS